MALTIHIKKDGEDSYFAQRSFGNPQSDHSPNCVLCFTQGEKESEKDFFARIREIATDHEIGFIANLYVVG